MDDLQIEANEPDEAPPAEAPATPMKALQFDLAPVDDDEGITPLRLGEWSRLPRFDYNQPHRKPVVVTTGLRARLIHKVLDVPATANSSGVTNWTDYFRPGDQSNQSPWRIGACMELFDGDAPPRAGRKEWIGLAVLTLACLLYVMDLTVLHLAVPHLSADLRPSSAQLLWIIDIYGFVVAGSLITMGTLGDRIGRRRLLMIGALSFAAVSVLAAFSTSAGMLIASRALMGVAGAMLAPSTL